MSDPRPNAAEPLSLGAAERPWRQLVAPFTQPDPRRGIIQVVNTALPYGLVLALLFWGLAHGFYAVLLLVPVGAGLLVRLFAIQHDCGHGSFFRSRWANDGLGRILGVLTLTPYDFWRRSHASHHATSGNLDRRGVGDVALLTVREYCALPALARLRYRLYRHPIVMFGIGPTYQFLLAHRVATGCPMRDRAAWGSVLGTNLAIAALVTLAGLTLGLGPFLLGYLPVAIGAASIGVWLFYVQHQFEEAYWTSGAEWNHRAAALEGCSFYDLPWLLHVGGDVHNPLHCTARFTQSHPKGDQGGNQVFVKPSATNPGTNLHALWDDAVGTDVSEAYVNRYAAEITAEFVKAVGEHPHLSKDPKRWVDEGFELAKHDVYTFGNETGSRDHPLEMPAGYEANAVRVSRIQIAKAGFRLAEILNSKLGH